MAEIKKPEFINVQQQNRIYHFPNGKVQINEVVSVNVSKSGTHRLNDKNGKKYIVPSGWLCIEFDATDWTF